LTDRGGYDVSILIVTDGLDGWSCGWHDPGFLTLQQADNVLWACRTEHERRGKNDGLNGLAIENGTFPLITGCKWSA
jgi:hypothetical protein